MFLIQFIDDGLYQIVHKISNRKGEYCKSVWLDNRKYSAKIIARHDNYKLLNNIKKQLEKNIPHVLLSPMEKRNGGDNGSVQSLDQATNDDILKSMPAKESSICEQDPIDMVDGVQSVIEGNPKKKLKFYDGTAISTDLDTTFDSYGGTDSPLSGPTIHKKIRATDENENEFSKEVNNNTDSIIPNINTGVQSGEIEKSTGGEKSNISTEEDEFFNALSLKKCHSTCTGKTDAPEKNESMHQQICNDYIKEADCKMDQNSENNIINREGFVNKNLKDCDIKLAAINIITGPIDEKKNETKKSSAKEVLPENLTMNLTEIVPGEYSEQNDLLNNNILVGNYSEHKIVEHNQVTNSILRDVEEKNENNESRILGSEPSNIGNNNETQPLNRTLTYNECYEGINEKLPLDCLAKVDRTTENINNVVSPITKADSNFIDSNEILAKVDRTTENINNVISPITKADSTFIDSNEILAKVDRTTENINNVISPITKADSTFIDSNEIMAKVDRTIQNINNVVPPITKADSTFIDSNEILTKDDRTTENINSVVSPITKAVSTFIDSNEILLTKPQSSSTEVNENEEMNTVFLKNAQKTGNERSDIQCQILNGEQTNASNHNELQQIISEKENRFMRNEDSCNSSSKSPLIDSLVDEKDEHFVGNVVNSSMDEDLHISKRYDPEQVERGDDDAVDIDKTATTHQEKDPMKEVAISETRNRVTSNMMMLGNDCESLLTMTGDIDEVAKNKIHEIKVDGKSSDTISIIAPEKSNSKNVNTDLSQTHTIKMEGAHIDNLALKMSQFTLAAMNNHVDESILIQKIEQPSADKQSENIEKEKPNDGEGVNSSLKEISYKNNENHTENTVYDEEVMPQQSKEVQAVINNCKQVNKNKKVFTEENSTAKGIKILNIEKVTPSNPLFNQVEAIIQQKHSKLPKNVGSRLSPKATIDLENILEKNTESIKNINSDEDKIFISAFDPENDNHIKGTMEPSVIVEIINDDTLNVDSQTTNFEKSVCQPNLQLTSSSIDESKKSPCATRKSNAPALSFPNVQMQLEDDIESYNGGNMHDFQVTDDEMKYLAKLVVECDLYATEVDLDDSLLQNLHEENTLEAVRQASFDMSMDMNLSDFHRNSDEIDTSFLNKTINSPNTSNCHDDLFQDAPENFPKYYEQDNDADDDGSNYVSSDISEPENDEDNDFQSNSDEDKNSKAENLSDDRNGLNLSAINDGGYTAPSSKHMFVRSTDEVKVYYCAFCCKIVKSKFARHLEVHAKTHKEVQEFMAYPPKHPQRRKLIDKLRKEHAAIFNRDSNINDGELLVCRRQNRKSTTVKSADAYVQCISCDGTMAKSNIRHHFASCTGGKYKGKGSSLAMSRMVMGRIHPRASKILRQEIFPDLRDDDVVEQIRYDEIVILYFNHLAEKYPSPEDHSMLRQKLRILGRLLIALKNEDSSINCFLSLFIPKHHETCIAAVRAVARYDENLREFGAPTTAITIGTMLKQIGKFVENLYIVREDPQSQKRAKDFVQLITEKFELINRIAAESLAKRKQLKKVILPSSDDIDKLMAHLQEERKLALAKLKMEYSYKAWLTLCETNLLILQLFNRRRQGEASKIQIQDYHSREGIDEKVNKDLFKGLSSKCKEIATSYKRFEIRGKLGRTVAILLTKEMENSLETMLSFRGTAEVDSNNPYLFGLPSLRKRKTKRLVACDIIRPYADACGADIPTTLRGTLLRKHIATMCAHLSLSDPEITNLTKFLGHAQKIHFSHYRQRADIEILKVSQLLEKASGIQNNTEETIRDGMEAGPSNAFEENPSKFTRTQKVTFEGNITENNHFTASVKPSRSHVNEKHSSDSEEGSAEWHPQGLEENDDTDESIKVPQRKNPESKKKITRTPWTLSEKQIIVANFSKHLENFTFPLTTVIEKLRTKYYEIIGRRTSKQIKAWICNHHRSKKK